MRGRVAAMPGVNAHSLADHKQASEEELTLVNDPDSSILVGITSGFRLTSPDSNFSQVEVDNYPSTTAPPPLQGPHRGAD